MYICIWSNWIWKDSYHGRTFCVYNFVIIQIIPYETFPLQNIAFMQSGPKELNKQTIGVNYRALNDLFHLSEERKDTIRYEIAVQMIEIYNEQVRDLLATDGVNKRYPFYLLFLIWRKLLPLNQFSLFANEPVNHNYVLFHFRDFRSNTRFA